MDDAYPASSSSSRRRTTPAWPDRPCPGLGSARVVLGGATYRGAQVGEEPACRWPEPSLVAVAWASDGPEARGPRGGGASLCQWGGRARPSLLVCVGAQVLQYLAGSPGISLELWSCDGSFSLGVHCWKYALEAIINGYYYISVFMIIVFCSCYNCIVRRHNTCVNT